MKKKLTEKEINAIFHEDSSDYDLVEEGEWINEGKYQFCTHIFKDTEGLHWSVSAQRTGSHYTDWDYYYEDELIQVEQKEVVTKKWVAVK